MQTSAETYLSKIIHNNTLRTHIRQSLAVLSLLVVLTVFWGLKLTGITLAGEAFCGKEEHTHSEECPLRNLICELDEMEAHTHTEACLVRELICELEETDAHHHTDDCLTQIPVCTLPEQEAHTHSDECLIRTLTCGLPEQEGHNHSDDCLSKTLSCGLQEQQGHSHSDACLSKTLSCGQDEISAHTHNADCYRLNLVCSEPETEGHSHGSGCFELVHTCGLEENEAHTHDDSCLSEIQICQLPETEGHRHTDGCYQNDLICTMAETAGHSHCDDCYTTGSDYICGQEEVPAHQHSEDCYTIGSDIICGKEEAEAHSHSDECYTIEPGYGCGMEEMDAHTHTEECFTTEEGNFSCGLEETEGHTHCEECYRFGIGFGCGLTEAEGHVHTEECITEETEFGCEKISGPGHTHTDECYDILEYCPLEEHIHDVSCYSDITADLETSDDWEMSMADLIFSTRTSDNIVMVAKSQLGCVESQRNFQVDEFGIRHGITRYGQWYNNPYGDWSAMFVSFCLHYAGVEEIPFNAGVDAMRLEWETAGLYSPAEEFSPVVGHLLFLDEDQNGTADSVAIITELTESEILCVEGDVETPAPLPDETEEDGTETVAEILPLHVVAETAYAYDDPAVMGYGLVPFAPEVMIMMMSPRASAVIAQTTGYSSSVINEDNAAFVIYTTYNGSNFAFDGNGNAVPINIDSDGNISASVPDPDILLWTFASAGNQGYYIQNVSTQKYMHAYSSNGGGVITGSAYPSTIWPSTSGIRIRSNNSDYARLDSSNGVFSRVNGSNGAAIFNLGIARQCTVWLDGTDGSMMSYLGSPNERYSVPYGSTMTLPEDWDSTPKYDYNLRGWYDIVNHEYYAPGAEVTVTENMVFYADWVASSYNIGQYNSYVADTVSTSDFVTTRMFDYGVLFNVLSQTVDVDVSASDHKETWQLLTSGTNPYNGEETLNYIFRDWDNQRDISYPNGTNSHNTYDASITVHPGLYSAKLHELLFSTGNSFDPETGTGVIGKQYLGTADHLFQLMTDPNDEFYGYYYYDSERNAAAYNQSAGRFYVYDYLERSSDSNASGAEGTYTDFLPLNSPYVNTNGRTPATYSYAGVDGEYPYTDHYLYEAKDGTNSPVGANYLFGMSIDIDFYLPNKPGTSGGNMDLYGNEMHFHFSGDDDVWVLVDGQLVLDIGGIHGIETGDINFSTGTVTVNGSTTGSVTNLNPGDHKLTILYLERGSSQSNCAIYFNLAPRFSFSIQKEDILTRDVLNGAQFSVYTDQACTVPAELWTSKASHDSGAAATNVFTVTNGVAHMWGMGAGNTYYIKETRPPDNSDYEGVPNGIIELTFDKEGAASYNVNVISDGSSSVSPGFTVHGFRIDEETQQAYIVATNAPTWVKEVTSVQARKVWNDQLSHSGDTVTVYLTVTDQDGIVQRIREVQLSSKNNWTHVWDNLPKNWPDGSDIEYSIEEAYVPGYMATVEPDEKTEVTGQGWIRADRIEAGKTYLFQTGNGYLYANSNGNLGWTSDQNNNRAQWTANWVDEYSCFRFVNGAGHVLTSHSSERYFYSTTSNVANQCLNVSYTDSGLRIYAPTGSGNFYFQALNTSNGRATASTSESDGQVFTPYIWGDITQTVESDDLLLRVVNTPLETETALSVHKVWDYGFSGLNSGHEEAQVTVRLLANGKNTGRTVTLNLKNNWTASFRGLPYQDSNGNVIRYTVEEVWSSPDWIPYYGEVIPSGGDPPTYSTTITNTFRWGTGAELPSTGSAARMMYTYCGISIMLGSLVYGIVSRRRRERRKE